MKKSILISLSTAALALAAMAAVAQTQSNAQPDQTTASTCCDSQTGACCDMPCCPGPCCK